jgi:hypothetical protein
MSSGVEVRHHNVTGCLAEAPRLEIADYRFQREQCTVGRMGSRRTFAYGVRTCAPVGLALMIMSPRLASPQFGLLDDGLTLRIGREIAGTWGQVFHLIPESGRFFPAYWLAYSAIFEIVGARPVAFFAVNVLLFVGLLGLLNQLVQLAGGTRWHAALAAGLFSLSGPAIETFYTLSKAEALQMTWVGVSLRAAAAAAERQRWARVVLAGLSAAALLMAHATKETSVVLIPISLGWLAIDRWSSRERGTPFATTYVAANLVAALAFAGLRAYFAPLGLAEGWYTRAYSLTATTVGAAVFRIAAWMVRDFVFLLPLVVVAVRTLIDGRPASRRLILYALVWMGGWVAVFLPWPATFAYYLLPFALGAAVLGGAVIGDVARAGDHRARRGAVAWGILAATAALWLVTIANTIADARVQLTVDRANAELIAFLANLPRESRIVLNTDQLTEYLFELPVHLTEIMQRPDIVVEHVNRSAHDRARSAPTFVVTPDVTNPPVPTVRVAIDEEGAKRVNASLSAILGGRGELVYRYEERALLLELGIHRLLCPMSVPPFVDRTYCPSGRGLIFRRTFEYGWQVHRLAWPPPNGGRQADQDRADIGDRR